MRREPGELAERFAIPLQHEYTKENLCFTGLKGDDSIVAEVLKSCRDKTGEQWLDLHLCLVTKYKDIDPDCDEVNYEEIQVKNWIGLDDERAVAFEKVDIDMDREVAVREGEQPFHDEPNVEKHEDYTGNEGPTLELWYHRAMLVAWPRKRSIFRAIGIRSEIASVNTAPGVAGDLGKKRKKMGTEIIDLCRPQYKEQ
ncbi:unnamed protein product [Calypogeia fissa]